MNLYKLMNELEKAHGVSGSKAKKDVYDIKIEAGDMTFHVDIKDLEKLFIKLNTIGTILEGGK